MHERFSTELTSSAGCVQSSELFQDPLLEETPGSDASSETRRRYADLKRTADGLCRSCPLLRPCLVAAVVTYDVAGFVAATTRKQRLEIRRRLGVRVEPEDFDSLTGGPRQHRQVDHAEVVRLHLAHPLETYEQLARRLGCSLSTVKRHLRAERQSSAPAPPRRRDPSAAEVLAAFSDVAPPKWLGENAA